MISEMEARFLAAICKREEIRFARISQTLLKHDDLAGGVIRSAVPDRDSDWEAVLVIRAGDDEDEAAA